MQYCHMNLCIFPIFTDESIELEISRSLPAAGQVSLLWTISGVGEHLPDLGFSQTSGQIMFEEVCVGQRSYRILPHYFILSFTIFHLNPLYLA